MRIVAMSLLLAIAACESAPPAPRALLNENTAVTLTIVAEPLLFARVRSVTTDAGHDFATVVAVEKDDGGKYTDLLLLYRWSIPSYGGPPAPEESAGRLLIEADGHEIELQPLDGMPIDLSRRKELFLPEHVDVVMHAYASDFQTMRLIAASHDLTLRVSQDPLNAPFWLWRDGRPALALFVSQLNGS
jgi:hypothetical protein